MQIEKADPGPGGPRLAIPVGGRVQSCQIALVGTARSLGPNGKVALPVCRTIPTMKVVVESGAEPPEADEDLTTDAALTSTESDGVCESRLAILGKVEVPPLGCSVTGNCPDQRALSSLAGPIDEYDPRIGERVGYRRHVRFAMT
jgi:hypothetical protein